MLIQNHEIVMNLNVEQLVEERRYFSTDGMENHSSQSHAEREGYFIPAHKWEEMGSPEQITIQVVPGDALNHHDSEGEVVSENQSEQQVTETTTERVTEQPAEPNSLGNVTEAVAGQPTETVRETETERVVQEPAEQGDGSTIEESNDSSES